MVPPILQRIAVGDSDAVRDCIDLYGTLVWSLARRLSTTTSDAEDATQDIFLDIWRKAADFDASQGSEKIFIALIARRCLIDRLRKSTARLRVDSLAETLEPVGWRGKNCKTAAEPCKEVEPAARALADLPSEHQQVLELGILQGLPQAEIGKRLDLSLGAVKSTMRHGLMLVREHLLVDADRSTEIQSAVRATPAEVQRGNDDAGPKARALVAPYVL